MMLLGKKSYSVWRSIRTTNRSKRERERKKREKRGKRVKRIKRKKPKKSTILILRERTVEVVYVSEDVEEDV